MSNELDELALQKLLVALESGSVFILSEVDVVCPYVVLDFRWGVVEGAGFVSYGRWVCVRLLLRHLLRNEFKFYLTTAIILNSARTLTATYVQSKPFRPHSNLRAYSTTTVYTWLATKRTCSLAS